MLTFISSLLTGELLLWPMGPGGGVLAAGDWGALAQGNNEIVKPSTVDELGAYVG